MSEHVIDIDQRVREHITRCEGRREKNDSDRERIIETLGDTSQQIKDLTGCVCKLASKVNTAKSKLSAGWIVASMFVFVGFQLFLAACCGIAAWAAVQGVAQ